MGTDGMEEDADARSMAEKVVIWIAFDEDARRPVVWFENAGTEPVYGLAVRCDGHITGEFPAEKPHQGRYELRNFTNALGYRYAHVDDDWDRERADQVDVGCVFRDVDDRWWARTADGTLLEAECREDAGRSVFEGMRRPGRRPWIRVVCE